MWYVEHCYLVNLVLHCLVSFQALKILGWSKLMSQQLSTHLLPWWLRRFFRVESFLLTLTSGSTGTLETFQVLCQWHRLLGKKLNFLRMLYMRALSSDSPKQSSWWYALKPHSNWNAACCRVVLWTTEWEMETTVEFFTPKDAKGPQGLCLAFPTPLVTCIDQILFPKLCSLMCDLKCFNYYVLNYGPKL